MITPTEVNLLCAANGEPTSLMSSFINVKFSIMASWDLSDAKRSSHNIHYYSCSYALLCLTGHVWAQMPAFRPTWPRIDTRKLCSNALPCTPGLWASRYSKRWDEELTRQCYKFGTPSLLCSIRLQVKGFLLGFGYLGTCSAFNRTQEMSKSFWNTPITPYTKNMSVKLKFEHESIPHRTSLL